MLDVVGKVLDRSGEKLLAGRPFDAELEVGDMLVADPHGRRQHARPLGVELGDKRCFSCSAGVLATPKSRPLQLRDDRQSEPVEKSCRNSLDPQIVAYTINGEVITVSKSRNTTIDDIAGECIAVRLRMLNRVVTNIYDDALRTLGLKVSQMNILVAAAKMGTARPTDVCEHLHLDVSTLSRNVERMKARGWLEVVPDEDGRSQPFRLTSQGRRLLERAIPSWEAAQERVTELLGSDIVNHLNHAMRSINADTTAG